MGLMIESGEERVGIEIEENMLILSSRDDMGDYSLTK